MVINFNEDSFILIDSLRESLIDAIITTYEYEPLVGVTSIKDPKGEVTEFIYDTFNRLKEVRDSEGNLITDHSYHYRVN